MDKNLIEALKFVSRRDITKLYKDFLSLLQDMSAERAKMNKLLEQVIPPSYHILLDGCSFFDENVQAKTRKKVLDLGNDAIRNQIELIEKIECLLETNYNKSNE